MTKKPTVCVLRYNHKHGTDISVYPSMAAAERSCIDIVLQNIHELPDPLARRTQEQCLTARGFTTTRPANRKKN